MTAAEIFHSHLEICDQCMSHPFDLCTVGRKLMADYQGEGTGTGVHVTEDLSDSDVEATGQFLFGMPVVRVKPIDVNRLYSRYCDPGQLGLRCQGHMVMLAINTMPIGICVGVTMVEGASDGLVQQRRFMSVKEARTFFKEIHDRTVEIGYQQIWQGGTLFDDKNVRSM